MEKILIDGGDYISAVIVGGRWEAVVKLIPADRTVILTDGNIAGIYGASFPKAPVLIVSPGETSKKLRLVEKLASGLVRAGVDREGFILGIGGGVVSDLAGFLASVYMRGVRCGFVSTSLLSMVDASTGGKNGVNLGKYKNLIGCFRQPEFVICDTAMLRTLPEEEYYSGLAELIKTGIIGDKSIISELETHSKEIRKRDKDLLTGLVTRSVKFKAAVVAEDEKETGLRRILNFGHTFGHAIELHSGLKHGFAVASGMELAAAFSLALGYLPKTEYDLINSVLHQYNLAGNYDITPGLMEKLVMHDKKKSGRDINFVFIKGIEKPFTEKIPVKELIKLYKSYLKGNLF